MRGKIWLTLISIFSVQAQECVTTEHLGDLCVNSYSMDQCNGIIHLNFTLQGHELVREGTLQELAALEDCYDVAGCNGCFSFQKLYAAPSGAFVCLDGTITCNGQVLENVLDDCIHIRGQECTGATTRSACVGSMAAPSGCGWCAAQGDEEAMCYPLKDHGPECAECNGRDRWRVCGPDDKEACGDEPTGTPFNQASGNGDGLTNIKSVGVVIFVVAAALCLVGAVTVFLVGKFKTRAIVVDQEYPLPSGSNEVPLATADTAEVHRNDDELYNDEEDYNDTL